MGNVERTGPNSARAALSCPLPPGRLLAAVESAVRSLPRWRVEESGDDGLRAVRKTRVFRFEDDVVVRVRPEGEGSRAEFESASRVGRSDLGQNPRNLRELLDALDRHGTSPGPPG
jgi:uncharacterized protein (DUF1499 family)